MLGIVSLCQRKPHHNRQILTFLNQKKTNIGSPPKKYVKSIFIYTHSYFDDDVSLIYPSTLEDDVIVLSVPPLCDRFIMGSHMWGIYNILYL